jgi:hypothetical protein
LGEAANDVVAPHIGEQVNLLSGQEEQFVFVLENGIVIGKVRHVVGGRGVAEERSHGRRKHTFPGLVEVVVHPEDQNSSVARIGREREVVGRLDREFSGSEDNTPGGLGLFKTVEDNIELLFGEDLRVLAVAKIVFWDVAEQARDLAVDALVTARYNAGWFLAYRSLGLLSGVAPEVPSGSAHIEAIDSYLEDVFSAEIWMPGLAIIFFWAYILEPWKNLRSLEYWPYGYAYVLAIGLVYWAMAVIMSQFLLCWKRFQRFLQWLETQSFRNAFSQLGPQLSRMALVYKLDGGPLSFSKRGLDCLEEIESLEAEEGRLVIHGNEGEAAAPARTRQPAAIKAENISRLIGALETMISQRGQIDGPRYIYRYARLQNGLDEKAGEFFDELKGKVWANGSVESAQQERSQAEDPDRILFLKQRFIVVRYLIYIRYVIRHLRNLLWFLVVSFILSVVSLESYVFQGRRAIDITCILTFVALGIGIVIVLSAWDKDATLSRIMETKPNEIGRDFYVQLVRYGALPLFTLLASQFPSISRFLLSWLQPALEGLK